MQVTVGGVSRLVDRIVAAGLLVREADPADRRAARATITPEGERTLAAAAETYDQEAADVLDPALTPDEQQRMYEYTRRLLAGA